MHVNLYLHDQNVVWGRVRVYLWVMFTNFTLTLMQKHLMFTDILKMLISCHLWWKDIPESL